MSRVLKVVIEIPESEITKWNNYKHGIEQVRTDLKEDVKQQLEDAGGQWRIKNFKVEVEIIE